MTNIEQKALELVNEVQAEEGYTLPSLRFKRSNDPFCEALCRAIERHESFRQEVSDAVVEAVTQLIKDGNPDCGVKANAILSRFIIAKPDPLVEALCEMMMEKPCKDATTLADKIRAALAKRGLEIREKSDG